MANPSNAPTTRMCTECARDFELEPGATGRPPSKCPECRTSKSSSSRSAEAPAAERTRATRRAPAEPEVRKPRRAPGKSLVKAPRRQPSVRAQRDDLELPPPAQASPYEVPEIKERILGEIDELESAIAARLRVPPEPRAAGEVRERKAGGSGVGTSTPNRGSAAMETQAAPASGGSLDTWAIVEMFGHKRIAGKLSEHVIGSAALIRVDVPETQLDETTKSQAFTRYVGVGSIYGITPCSEEVARAAASRIVRYDPPIPLEFQPPAQLAARTTDAEIVDDDDDAAGDITGPIGTADEDDEEDDPGNPIE